ncbi:hypothetical protein Peur_016380 [Populus x canadensis]
MSTTEASRSYLRRCQNGIRTESRIQTSFFSISHLQTNPLLPSHCQVTSGDELLCRDNASIPHCHSSALLNSMLSVSRRSCGWTPEGKFTVSLYELIDWL